ARPRAAGGVAFDRRDGEVARIEHQLGGLAVLPLQGVGGGAGQGAAVEVQGQVQGQVFDHHPVRLRIGMLVTDDGGHLGLRSVGGRGGGGGSGAWLTLAADDQQRKREQGNEAAEQVRGKTHGGTSPRGTDRQVYPRPAGSDAVAVVDGDDAGRQVAVAAAL